MSDGSYYNWKAKYAGLAVSELKRLKALEEENRYLKQIMGEQAQGRVFEYELVYESKTCPRRY